MLPDDTIIDTSSFSQDHTISISDIGSPSFYYDSATTISIANPTYSVNTLSGYASASAAAITADDLVLHRDGKPTIKVGETLDTILERLCILQPNFEKMEQYPALKAAYDNYKMIEALIANDSDNK